MDATDLTVIGLTCNLVGVFFLANSIIFRRPRRVIEEFFGVGAGSIATIRDYALNKMQVVIGFLFLNSGFLLQIAAKFGAVEGRIATITFCFAIIAASVVVYLIGAYSSRRSFRRLLREFFQSHPWSFTENMALTKEIGSFLGIQHTQDMTVEDYVQRVRTALGIDPKQPRPNPAKAVGKPAGRRVRDVAIPGR